MGEIHAWHQQDFIVAVRFCAVHNFGKIDSEKIMQ